MSIPKEFKEEFEKDIEEEHKAMAEYKTKHCRCPQCGSKEYETKMLAYFKQADRSIIDKNPARCHDCGWTGIVHDLSGDDNEVPSS
jgi:predicted nucleic-acid-binding Zn-ribbon protein